MGEAAMAQLERHDGGQVALTVAVAHLDELLRAVESSNSRAMFLVGLNVASNSLFVAVLASLEQPWTAAVFPVTIALLSVALGLWVLGQRRHPQFPSPEALLDAGHQGLSDSRLSWLVVEAVALASLTLNRELGRLARWVTTLQILTATHLLGLTATGLALIL